MKIERVKKIVFQAALIILTITSAILLFHRAGDRSLCGDEMELRRMARQPVSRIMKGWPVQAEPVEQLIKHFSIMISDNPVNQRILGLLGGILMVFLTGLLAGKLMGRWGGLTAAWLVLLCPGVLKWGQFSRFYTFGSAIMLLATYLFFRALENDRWKDWIWYGVIAFLQIQTWRFGMPHLAVCAVIFGLAWLFARLPFKRYYAYGHLNFTSLLKIAAICFVIALLLVLQYYTFNKLIIGILFNPVNNDGVTFHGAASFSWESFRYVYQEYLPAYMHYRWLLVMGVIAALIIDREKGFLFVLLSLGFTYLIIYGMNKNKVAVYDSRMLFTVPFWAYFISRGAWFFTDLFWRSCVFLRKKLPSNQYIKYLQWIGAALGIVWAAYLLIPLQKASWNGTRRHHFVDMTYCRNIGDFLADNVGTNDSVYYEDGREGLPAKFYYEKKRDKYPEMIGTEYVLAKNFQINSEDINKLKNGASRMWLLPNWRRGSGNLPGDLRNWINKHNITLSIPHPWVPWSGPQKIIIADKNYENLSPYEYNIKKIDWLKKFYNAGLYYNDSASELIKLCQKNNLTNEFSDVFYSLIKKYPDEPVLAETLAEVKLTDEQLDAAVLSFPSSGALQSKMARWYRDKNNTSKAVDYYTAAMRNSHSKIYDGPVLRELLKEQPDKKLISAIEKQLRNPKTTSKLSDDELVAWAISFPHPVIYYFKDEQRCLKFAIGNNVSNDILMRRIDVYPFENKWECMGIANVLTHSKKYDLTVAWLTKCIDKGVHEYEIAERLAESYKNLGRPDDTEKMISALQNYIDWLPENDLTNRSVGLYKLGMNYAKEGKDEDAIKSFIKTANSSEECNYHPMLFRAWIQLGHLARKRKEWDEAVMSYEKVLELEPNHKSTMMVLADMYREAGNPEAEKAMRDKVKSF